jgi:hypothetical protein
MIDLVPGNPGTCRFPDALQMWATATGKGLDHGSLQFSPTHIFSPVDWTCKHCEERRVAPRKLIFEER